MPPARSCGDFIAFEVRTRSTYTEVVRDQTKRRRGRPPARITPVRSTRKGKRVKLPLLKGKGQPGPLCPTTETPYDLVFDIKDIYVYPLVRNPRLWLCADSTR